MIIEDDVQLASTRAKFARLEARYEALRNDTEEDKHLRELTMRSLKRYINQFKEDIVWYEAGRSGHGRRPARRRILSEIELVNTRRKLSELERRYETSAEETGGDAELRRISLQSLKKFINQLKEEIIWTEVHQPARREAVRS